MQSGEDNSSYYAGKSSIKIEASFNGGGMNIIVKLPSEEVCSKLKIPGNLIVSKDPNSLEDAKTCYKYVENMWKYWRKNKAIAEGESKYKWTQEIENEEE